MHKQLLLLTLFLFSTLTCLTGQWISSGELYDIFDMAASGNLIFAAFYWRGVYISSDNGMTWQAFNLGLPRHRSYSIAASSDKVYLGTLAASIWERDIKVEALNGLAYADLNNNGIRDGGEAPVPNIIVKGEPNGLYSTSGADGKFTALALASDSIRSLHKFAVCHGQSRLL